MPYKENNKWRAVVKSGGKRLSRYFRTKTQALKWEREEKEKLTKALKRPLRATGLYNFCARYLDFAKVEYTKKTYDEKRIMVRNIINAWDDIDIRDVTPHMISEYLLTQREVRSANAANKDRKNLLAMFNWGQNIFGLEVIPLNPVVRIKKFKHDVAPQETYSEKEIAKLLLATNRWEHLLISTFLETAGRRNEVLRLAWSDVNIEKQAICLWTRKTRDGSKESAWLPITPKLAGEFAWLFKTREDKENLWVFPSAQTGKPYENPKRLLQNMCARAGVRYLGFHAFRRYVASILADKHKVSMKAVQHLLRHKKQTTTERYLYQIHSDLKDYAGMAIPQDEKREDENKS